jgi:uncharacterized membrane protein YfhO
MPAPRRAILSDITDKKLNTKGRLVVGRDGRLHEAKKPNTETLNVQETSYEFSTQVQEILVESQVFVQEPSFVELQPSLKEFELSQTENVAATAVVKESTATPMQNTTEAVKTKVKSRKKTVKNPELSS